MVDEKLKLADPARLKVLAFGASLVEGYTNFGRDFHPFGITLRTKLSSVLSDLGITVDINGQSGDRVLARIGGTYLQRLQSACKPHYDLVIILGGTNDLGWLISNPDCATDIFQGLKDCYEHILNSGASLLCLTVPERAIDSQASVMARKAKTFRLQLNALVEEYVRQHRQDSGDAKEQKAYYFDLASLVPFQLDKGNDGKVLNDIIWSNDGLHMNPAGYDFVGEKLAEYIVGLIKETPTVADNSTT